MPPPDSAADASSPATAPIVRLRDVTKTFNSEQGPVPVLRSVDLCIRAGEKASLIGPSGSGKSTLLALIAGLLRPTDGTVEIDGTSIRELNDSERAGVRAERIGIALQADNLIPFLSAIENVELALGFGPPGRRGLRGRRRSHRTRALDLLERFGVADRASHRPRHLSGGEAQRVALAVALANRPALLLADEVVAQLDGATAGHVVDEVLSGDFAVLYVTHDVALADRVERRYRLHDHGIELR